MSAFLIEGGNPLSGTITPQGAKNEALQVICATLLTPGRVVIKNIPDILDVNNLIQLLRDIGVDVERLNRNDYAFKAENLNLDYLPGSNQGALWRGRRGGGLCIPRL